MELLNDQKSAGPYRNVLIAFLNENGLDGMAILAITRQAEPVRCPPQEMIFRQGQAEPHVFFLVEGQVAVRAHTDGDYRELGERRAVCVLGEISFFNGTAPTADVVVKGDRPAVLFRVGYEPLQAIIAGDPRVKECLNRIGELRLITQNNGFASYQFFMDLIGWKRNRFLLDHQVLPHLEDTIRKELIPRFGTDRVLLEVGDGPGIVSELLLEQHPEVVERLFIQASNMESAVMDPFTPQPSDLERARFLNRNFDLLVALQVFNVIPSDKVTEQFQIAHRLIKPGGYLILLKMRMLSINYPSGSSESDLFFKILEGLVDQIWPGAREDQPLIETIFEDADLDALMRWNRHVSARAAENRLRIPDELGVQDRELLERFLTQARAHLFNPDVLHFHWLSARALEAGFTLESFDHQSDLGYYYQVLYRF